MNKAERLKEDSLVNKMAMPIAIRVGDQPLDAAMAARILTECRIDVQDKRDKGGEITVLRYLEDMIRGNWRENSQIHFCRLDNRLILVNGYHRMRALERFGKQLRFNVQIVEVSDELELGDFYASFDRHDRKRSHALANNAVGLAALLDVSNYTATAVDGSLDLIRNGMRYVRQSDTRTLVEMSIQEVRTQMALAWKHEAQLWDSVLIVAHGHRNGLKARLAKGPCTAVALQTLRHVGRQALDFWLAVAANDGLRVGTPQHTLVQAFSERTHGGSERKHGGGDERNFIVPALAWNAYYNGRKLSVIRENQTKTLVIDGTPIGRRALV